jgi:threonine/homoserine/homoserine lactone efflux protein
MTIDILVAFALFAFVSSITPGPNNLMLLASGMNFGFRASVPHMLGISGGFFILLLAVGFGLGEVFARQPITYAVMKWAGAIYLVYLAWRIANAGAVADPEEGAIKPTPLGFTGAALFQWVNPKAWVMAASTFSIYLPPNSGWALGVAFAALFTAINLPCVSCWTLFGSRLKRWLKDPRYARVFNIVMAVLLLASLVPILRDH